MRYLSLLLLAGCTIPGDACPDICMDGNDHIAWWCGNCRATVRDHGCDSCSAVFRIEYRRERWICPSCRIACRTELCWSCGCALLCFAEKTHIAWWCGACSAPVQGHACVTCRGEFRRNSRRDAWTCAKCGSSCRANPCWKCGTEDGASDDGRYAPWTCSKCGRKNQTYRCPACDPK